MNCWNHTDTPAVAQCAQCGKFLCKECAIKYKAQAHQILCDECFAEFRIEQEEEAQEEREIEAYSAKLEKRSRLLCMIGTMIGVPVAVVVAFAFLSVIEGASGIGAFIIAIFIINMGFMPYGWRAMGTFFGVRSWWGSFWQFAIKYFVSWYIGGPCFIYHMIHYVIPEHTNRHKE